MNTEQEVNGQTIEKGELPGDGNFLPVVRERDGQIFLEVLLFAEIRRHRIRKYALSFLLTGVN